MADEIVFRYNETDTTLVPKLNALSVRVNDLGGDGDKGDIIVSGGTWSIDAAVLSAYGRSLTAAASAAAARGVLDLGNVDNTSDANKPISTATATALAGKASTGPVTTSGLTMGTGKILYRKTAATGAVEEQTVATLKADLALTKADVGLSAVDNTSDLNKPISTATQTALNAKAPLASPTFTGTVSGITKTMVGLGNVDNTSDLAKPISTATQTALNAKLATAGGTLTGTLTAEGFFSKAQNNTANAPYWLQDETGLAQGILFWSRSDDTIRLRRYDTAGTGTEGELTMSSTNLKYSGSTFYVNLDRLLFQHNGTNGYIRTESGNLYLGAGGSTTLNLYSGGGAFLEGNFTSRKTVSGGVGATLGLTNEVNAANNQVMMYFGPNINGDPIRSAQIIGLSDGTNGTSLIFKANNAGSDPVESFRINKDSTTTFAKAVTINAALTVTGGITGGSINAGAGSVAGGDFTASRGNGTGVIFLGDGSRYVYYSGSRYIMPGAELSVNDGIVARHLSNTRDRAGITISTSAPSAGSGMNGDIWLKV